MKTAPICASLYVLLAAPAALAQGSFTVLGPSLFPTSVSADGSVVVGDDFVQYFRWTEADGLQLVGGNAAGNGAGGDASVSFDGTLLSGTRTNPQTGLFEMQRLDLASGVWSSTGTLGASSGASAGSGWGISGDGSTSVGLGWVNAGSAHGVVWTEAGGLVDLGSTVPNRSSRANATDYDGDVIVGWQDQVDGFRQAAIWTDGVQQTISLNGEPMSEAGVVSADGRWVGGNGGFANGGEAWLWTDAGGVVSLGHLNPTYSGATTGLSADGKRAVGFDRPFGPALFGRGFLWTAEFGMTDLNDVAAFYGIDVQGVTLSLPLAISADGRTIVGAGLSGFASVGWRLVLPDDPCGYQGYGYGASAANELVLTGEGSPDPGGLAELVVTNSESQNALLALSTGAGQLTLPASLVGLLDVGGLIGLYDMLPSALGARFAAPIPAGPTFAGVVLYAQAFAPESSQPGLLAASNGLRVTFCN